MRLHFAGALSALLSAAPLLAGPVGDAAKIGDLAELETLLDAGADPNEANPLATPLHFAAMNGHVDAVDLLSSRGAILDAPSTLGTPLHASARFDRADAMRALIAAGADPNARDNDGYTALMRASALGRVSAVRALVEGGADLNAVTTTFSPSQGPDGPSIALHEAKYYGHQEVVEVLEANGAGPIPPTVPENLAEMGDASRGEKLARSICKKCHTISAFDIPTQEFTYSGPPLIGLIRRPVADLPGFDYSEALLEHGGHWTPERVYAFALSPMLTVPGTLMDWAPDRTPQMVADIVAYFVAEAY